MILDGLEGYSKTRFPVYKCTFFYLDAVETDSLLSDQPLTLRAQLGAYRCAVAVDVAYSLLPFHLYT